MHTKGFTLIELLVVSVIMALAIGGGIAGYVRFNQNQVLEQSAKDVETFLRTVQKRVSSGVYTSDCEKLEGYKVSIQPTEGEPDTTLWSRSICSPERDGNAVKVKAQKVIVPEEILVEVNPTYIEFYVLDKGSNGGTISLKHSNISTHHFEVKITGAGLISTKKVEP